MKHEERPNLEDFLRNVDDIKPIVLSGNNKARRLVKMALNISADYAKESGEFPKWQYNGSSKEFLDYFQEKIPEELRDKFSQVGSSMYEIIREDSRSNLDGLMQGYIKDNQLTIDAIRENPIDSQSHLNDLIDGFLEARIVGENQERVAQEFEEKKWKDLSGFYRSITDRTVYEAIRRKLVQKDCTTEKLLKKDPQFIERTVYLHAISPMTSGIVQEITIDTKNEKITIGGREYKARFGGTGEQIRRDLDRMETAESVAKSKEFPEWAFNYIQTLTDGKTKINGETVTKENFEDSFFGEHRTGREIESFYKLNGIINFAKEKAQEDLEILEAVYGFKQ